MATEHEALFACFFYSAVCRFGRRDCPVLMGVLCEHVRMRLPYPQKLQPSSIKWLLLTLLAGCGAHTGVTADTLPLGPTRLGASV